MRSFSFSWTAPVSHPSSSSLPRNYFKIRQGKCSQCSCHEIKHLNVVHGKSGRIGTVQAKRVVAFAASDGHQLNDEFNSDSVKEADEAQIVVVKEEEFEEEEEEGEAEEGPSSRSSLLIVAERTEGKPGFVTFHGLSRPVDADAPIAGSRKETSKIFWFLGPTVLVAFLVLPSLFLRRVLSTVFEDSLLTDFLILFFMEALFYTGVAIFTLLIDYVWRPLQQVAPKDHVWFKSQFGLRLSSVATLVLSLIIPLVTMGMVWPWTGPAASATLAPYLVGLVIQFAFEQYAQYCKSPAWPSIPIIFQVYRLHQLNRAAQLVMALSFSVRGAETTSQTTAINNSLGTLLSVLQILGVICIWSLASFLMRFLPASQAIPDS